MSDAPQQQPSTAAVAPATGDANHAPADPNKALVQSVRAVVRAEIEHPTTDAEKKPGVWQVIALALLALDLALLFLLIDSQLQLSRDSVIVAVRRVTPLIGGAAFLAFLDDIRKKLLEWCRPIWVRIVVAALAIGLVLATFMSFNIYVRALPYATVMVDSAQQLLVPDSQLQRLPVRGLGVHQLKVLESGRTDSSASFTIGAMDVLRALRAPHGGADSARLQLMLPVHISTIRDSSTRYLVVTGQFDELFLREARKVAYVDSLNGAVRVWYRIRHITGRNPVKTTSDFAVPQGHPYDFALQPPLLLCAKQFQSKVINEPMNLEFNALCPSQTQSVSAVTDSVSHATTTRHPSPSQPPGIRGH